MNDIYFNMHDMRLIPEICCKAQNGVKDNIYCLGKIADQLTREIADFNEYSRRSLQNIRAHISSTLALADRVEQKILTAQGKIQRELPPPQKPSLPAKATQEEINSIAAAYHAQVSAVDEKNAAICQNNQLIREYVARCREVKVQLEKSIADLRQSELSARKDVESLTDIASVSLSHVLEAYGQGMATNEAICEFGCVFDKVVKAAEDLYESKPVNVMSYYYIDKQFAIKNAHKHFAGSATPGFLSAEAQETDPSYVPHAEEFNVSDEEVIIREKNAEAFLETARNSKRIRMPSANLHRLGGKAFTAKMVEMGYASIVQADGSLIDQNGMIHWEKRDG